MVSEARCVQLNLPPPQEKSFLRQRTVPDLQLGHSIFLSHSLVASTRATFTTEAAKIAQPHGTHQHTSSVAQGRWDTQDLRACGP